MESDFVRVRGMCAAKRPQRGPEEVRVDLQEFE
jgi:hypothetical protein